VGRVARHLRRARTSERTHRLQVGLATLVVAGLLGGCGGSDENAKFGKAFQPVNVELRTVMTSVGQAVAARPTDTQMASAFTRFATRLGTVKAHIDALKPPASLRTLVRSLSAAAGRLSADMRFIAVAARSHRPDAARAATVALVRDAQAALAAGTAIARKTGIKATP
jgi:hypothetical protein